MCKKKKCDIYNLLLCYNYFSSLAIQIANIVLSIIGTIITNLGLSKIPFHIDSYIYKFCFKLNILYFIIIILINISFFVFSYLDLINDSLNLIAYILSIVEIYTSVFGLISNFINDFLFLDSMTMYQKLAINKRRKNYPLLTDAQVLLTILIIITIFCIWINSILLSFSDNLLISLQINGSYSNYKLSKKIEEKYTLKSKKKIKKKRKPKNIIKDDQNRSNKNNNNQGNPNTNNNSNNKEQNNNKKNIIQDSAFVLNDLEDNNMGQKLEPNEQNKI
jgi:hypothetical protein